MGTGSGGDSYVGIIETWPGGVDQKLYGTGGFVLE